MNIEEVLINEPPRGKRLYQPVQGLDWPIRRKDCPQRLGYILANLVGNTVLDIGCSEGYFSRELSECGFKVSAIDNRPGLISVVQCLCPEVTCYTGEWVDYVGNFDNILFLSVFHNDAKRVGIEGALAKLHVLRGRTNRLFIEVPATMKERTGTDSLDFRTNESRGRLEQAIQMSIIDSVRFERLIFLCG